jgi:hypothetical protein
MQDSDAINMIESLDVIGQTLEDSRQQINKTLEFASYAQGAYVHGALTLAGLMALALQQGDTAALVLAIVAAFFAYVQQLLHASFNKSLGSWPMWASVAAGSASLFTSLS